MESDLDGFGVDVAEGFEGAGKPVVVVPLLLTFLKLGFTGFFVEVWGAFWALFSFLRVVELAAV